MEPKNPYTKKLNIASVVTAQYKPYSSNGVIMERKNIFKRNFKTKTINEKWVGDLTYIHTMKNGWCYLAPVMKQINRAITNCTVLKSKLENLNAINAITVTTPTILL